MALNMAMATTPFRAQPSLTNHTGKANPRGYRGSSTAAHKRYGQAYSPPGVRPVSDRAGYRGMSWDTGDCAGEQATCAQCRIAVGEAQV
jgi:hypothetical protein